METAPPFRHRPAAGVTFPRGNSSVLLGEDRPSGEGEVGEAQALSNSVSHLPF